MSSLNQKLERALDSRRRRNILRRLPSPTRGDSRELVDFVSNDYLSLTSYAPLRERVLNALQTESAILGSGGSRLLVNPSGHDALEERLRKFFDAPAALLFNSGFDANASFFASIPQIGDVVVYDEFIHASVHDGLRASRLARDSASGKKPLIPFEHNSIAELRSVLFGLLSNPVRGVGIRDGQNSVFVAVEALYSMDGTLAPLPEIIALLDELLPKGNIHLIVDEAHSTGLYGPQGRGLVAHYSLEKKVFARLHTFGKALASSGAVVLTSPLVKSYLLNYARPLIYTTALSCANVVAINCSFDLLEDGTTAKLAKTLHDLIQYALTLLRDQLSSFPPTLISLPPSLTSASSSSLLSPVIPILTPMPRPLSAHLRELGLNARPISWPTVPKGRDRVRVCLHAGNTKEEVNRLVEGVVSWAHRELDGQRTSRNTKDVSVQAKL
ncbi:hypothetical protein ACEPAG_7267 [Sanghuangporus baumii]